MVHGQQGAAFAVEDEEQAVEQVEAVLVNLGAMAGVGGDEIDVVSISDHFTINVVIGLEEAGFCKKGEGGSFVEVGALRIDGRLPTNTGGGYLSCTHAGLSGIFGLIEVIEQLRGTAGQRQVPGARLGYVHGVGGVFQSHYAAVLARV